MAAEVVSWVYDLQLESPSLANNQADTERLLAALARCLPGQAMPRIDLGVCRQIPRVLRADQGRVRCVVFDDGLGLVLVAVEPSESPVLGAAIDVGTTRVCLRLVDLDSKRILAESSFQNPQGVMGPDVLARIHACAEPGGLEQAQGLILGALEREIAASARTLGFEKERVLLLALAGNATMAHLLLGLEPRWLIREPYLPVVNSLGLVRCADLGLQLHPQARAYVFPNVGSYVGGDIIAGILSCGLHQWDKPSLLVDVGTNAEVVVGCKDFLVACAGAAGPALEGGAAAAGMEAGPGAIDRVTIDAGSHQVLVHTIDDEKPRGICGSGLIDLMAQLFLAGWIDIQARLIPSAAPEFIKEDSDGFCLELVAGADTASGETLVIRQRELVSLLKSKAAMFAILETITGQVGLLPEDMDRFFVAGAFGAVIDPASAIAIGMLPDVPRDRYQVVGNSSLEGASGLLCGEASVKEVEAIRDKVTYLELNVNQEFMGRFSGAQFLPHTDRSRFPSVTSQTVDEGLGDVRQEKK